jgi:hypothetical protein
MSVREMTWIACFVASEHLNEYGKETVRDMIEKTSCDTVIDFFEIYQRTFWVDMSEQLGYCNEIEEEMIE